MKSRVTVQFTVADCAGIRLGVNAGVITLCTDNFANIERAVKVRTSS